jgi:hypothetical protein
MKTLYIVSGHDLDSPPAIMRERDTQGNFVIRPEIRHLACPNCGKLDEKAALGLAVPRIRPIRTGRHIFPSFDELWIVQDVFRTALLRISSSEFQFTQIPSSPDFFVAVALNGAKPVINDPGYRFLNQCKVCHRYEQILWGRAPITVPSSNAFQAIDLECRLGLAQVWLVQSDVVEALSSHRPKLKGLVISPKEVLQN